MNRQNCFKCSKSFKKEHGKFFVEHLGLKFEVERDALNCDSCAKKEFIALLKRYQGLVKSGGKDGLVQVDWRFYHENCRHDRDSSDHQDLMLIILMAADVLSRQEKNHWAISNDGLAIKEYFFTDRRFVLGYFREFYKNGQSSFHRVHQFAQSYTGEQALALTDEDQ